MVAYSYNRILSPKILQYYYISTIGFKKPGLNSAHIRIHTAQGVSPVQEVALFQLPTQATL